MGHDHTHPVIVAFIAGVVLYLVFTDVTLSDPIKRMVFILLLLVSAMLLWQRYMSLP